MNNEFTENDLEDMKFFFEVSFGTQWVLVCELFRPVVVSGGSELNGVGIYTCVPAGRRFFLICTHKAHFLTT